MQNSRRWRHRFGGFLWALVAVAAIGTTGCQTEVGGQTLPSAYYLTDDIQYYAPGPEFILSKEAAALKAAKQDQELKEGTVRYGQ